MANWQATNVLSGAVEGPKYVEIGVISEIWSVALTTALANGDTILGPTMPAGCYVENVKVAATQLDSNGSPTLTFEAGYAGALAAFIASGNTTAQAAAGGIASMNVPGALGLTSASNIQLLVTITAGAATPKAGTMTLIFTYTASP